MIMRKTITNGVAKAIENLKEMSFKGPGDMFVVGGATRVVMQRTVDTIPVYFVFNLDTMIEESESPSLYDLFIEYGAPVDIFRDELEFDVIM